MKKFTVAILAFAVLAMGVVFAFAQTGGDGGKKGRGFGKRGGHHRGGMMRGIDLTDEQKAQFKSIRQSSKAKTQPLRESLKANRTKLREATANGLFDEAAVTALANEQAQLKAQLTVERARVQSQIFALLTDEQKTKLAEARETRKERMKNRREHRRGGKRDAAEAAPAGSEM